MIQEQTPQPREEHRRTETMGPAESREPRTREPYLDRDDDPVEPYAYGQHRESEPPAYDRSREYGEPRGYRENEPYAFDQEAPPEIKTVFSTSGINIIAGLWLLLAPFALGYSTIEAALWNSIILGLAIAVMAIVRVVQPEEHEGVSWVNFVLGIWLLVSPFVLALQNIQWLVWNNVIVGIIVLALAATSAMATRRYHDPTAGSSYTRSGSRRPSYSSSSRPRGRKRTSSTRW